MSDKPEKQYQGVWIPKEIWDSTELTWLEKCLLAEIHALDPGIPKTGCFASNEFLGGRFGVTGARMANVISKLRKAGWIKDKSFDGRTRKISISIRPAFTENVKAASRIPLTPFTDSVNPAFTDSVSKSVENRLENRLEGSRAVARPALNDSEWLTLVKSKECYRGINVEFEKEKSEFWCQENGRRFTRKFFTNWLNKCGSQMELSADGDEMGLPKRIFPKTGKEMMSAALERIKELRVSKESTKLVLKKDVAELIEFLTTEKREGWEARVKEIREGAANYLRVVTDEAKAEIERLNRRNAEIRRRMTV